MTERPFNNTSTQAERQQVHRSDTMRSRAESDFALGQSGRHAQQTRFAPEYPKLPETSPQNQMAQMPPEEPYGQDVNAMEPVGEYNEVQASLERLGDGVPVPSSPEAAAGVDPSSSRSTQSQPTMKRRGV
jgi:hypothetical protein